MSAPVNGLARIVTARRVRAARRLRRPVAAVLGSVLTAGAALVPAGAVVTAVTAAAVAAGHGPARAATGSVLILSTSVNGGTSSAEAKAVPAGYTVTVATAATWDAMSTAQFQAYSALVIGDPSAASCSSAPPAAAVSDAATWEAAVSGNVAVVGTAPAFAGSAGAGLISAGVSYAVAGTGTGLYVSLNCEDSTDAAGSSVGAGTAGDAGWLNGVEDPGGAGFTLTGQGGSCPDSGTVNTLEADTAAAFNGLSSPSLGPWALPACSVQESFNAWPASYTPLAYDSAATPSDFTASDGAGGQPYVLLGAPVTGATAALAPSTGGEVPAGAAAGGGKNPAAPGVSQATAGDPVDTETGDFSQSATDASVATFGPDLDFTRTYDAQAAQAQTQAGTPGPLGYGWTDNWATSLTTARPVPGDIYTMTGARTANSDGGPPAAGPLGSPDGVMTSGPNTYIADSGDNRVQEIAGTTGTQWGIAMTAGDEYTIAGSPAGRLGFSGDGGHAAAALLDDPESLAIDAAGNLYIADAGNSRIQEIAAATGTQRGVSMTAGDIYTIAGSAAGNPGLSGNGGRATAALLDDPTGVRTGFGANSSNIYITDAANARVQEVAAATGTQWGIAMTANDIYTVAGNAGGTSGDSGHGGKATSARLGLPTGVNFSSAGDMYLADWQNNQVLEVPAASGTQWGISMTANDIYVVAGSASGAAGASGNGGKATSALLNGPYALGVDNGTQLYVVDAGNSRIQEVARTAHTEWGVAMTANDIYTIAGSAAGAAGFSGDGGLATSAKLSSPGGVALDGSFNMYVADQGNNRLRKVTASTANISTAAGDAQALWDEGNGGPATAAAVNNPVGVASDPAGNVYVADTGNNRIQEVAAGAHTQFGISMAAGHVYTIAGSASGDSGDSGNGVKATSALLTGPIAVAADPAGDVYVTDEGNNRIVEIPAATGTQYGIAMTAGDLYTVAGSATGAEGSSGDGGKATSALLSFPWGLGIDSGADIFIADENNNRIQEVAAATSTQYGIAMTAGDIYTIAGSAAGASGNSGNGGKATSALLTAPTGIARDSAGSLFISDDGNNRVQEVAAVTGTHWGQAMTANDIYTVAGSAAGAFGTSGDGGKATAALLNLPGGIAVDGPGDLYIVDSDNNRIQEVAGANGTQWGTSMTAGDIYTVAGSAAGAVGLSGDGGKATSALLDGSFGITSDQSGNVYLTDNANNEIREVTSAAPGLFAEYPAPGGIVVTQDGGAQVTFYPQVSGACAAPYVPAGGYCALPQDTGASLTLTSGTYTFTPAPGSSFTYNTAGQLTGEKDTAGDAETVAYNSPAPGSGNCPAGASSCATIASASGRALVVGSNAAGLVTSVTDPLGRRWTYAYTGSDLTTVTDPMSRVTTYSYGPGTTGSPAQANDLLTITSPNAQPGGPDAGHPTVNAYNPAGQVTTQTDPAGHQSTFDYTAMNASTGNGVVKVADPDGNTTVYDYEQGTLAAQSDWTGGSLASEQDTIPSLASGGASGGTLLSAADFNGDGNKTAYTYDRAGNITSVTTPDGLGSQTATTTEASTALDNLSCSGSAQASSPCSASQSGPAPVAPGGGITPPSSVPPPGVAYNLDDTNGNQLYSTVGVYAPGATTASYSQTSYQLFKGNTVTVGGTPVSCAATPLSASLPCANINADGVVTQLVYDPQGDLTSSSAADGNGAEIATTSYGYDGDGEQTSETAPDGNLAGINAANYTTITGYDLDGEKTSITQAGAAGATVTPRATSYGYDANGNKTSVKDPRGYTTTTAFNADDQPDLTTDPDGNQTLACYDGDGDIAQSVPPTAVAAGSLTPASCPSSYPAGYTDRLAAAATTWTYDADGNQTATTTPAPAGQSGHETTTYTYDPSGNLIATVAPPNSSAPGAASDVTLDAYNDAGQLSAETTGYGTPAAATTTYCYDPNGDSTATVAPDGNTGGTATCQTSAPWAVSAATFPAQAVYQTTSSYDSSGELVSSTAPATVAAPSGATSTYAYDHAGNLLTDSDPNGVTTTWTYTPAGQRATASYSGSSAHSVSWSYDASGQQTGLTDGTGTSSLGYDPFGDLTSAQNGAGQITGYGYDPDQDLSSITYPLPATATWATTDTVGYGYDHADEQNSVTDFTGNQIAITNNADAQPTAETLGTTGDSITTSYDPAQSPSAIKLQNATTTLQSFSYSDAPSAVVLSETDTPSSPASPAAYAFDPRGRVLSMTPGTGSPRPYTFDASSNLTTLPGGASGSYDHASELTSATLSGTTTSYSYSADGQRLSAQRGGSAIVSGTWNGASELTAYSDPAATMSAAAYDGAGVRASATSQPSGGSAATASFVWNQSGQIPQLTPQLLMDSSSAYIYGPGGSVAEQVSLSGGSRQYLMTDTLNSVRGVVSSTGSLTATTSYDAFGNPLTTGGLSAYTPFGFAGGYTDPSGLIYLVSRYYDPATGQFLSVDPDLSQTLQPYEYASGNPVDNADPTGMDPVCRQPHLIRCETENLLWGNPKPKNVEEAPRATLHQFQAARDNACKGHLSGFPNCGNHGNTHGKHINWSSDGCSSPGQQVVAGFQFWKACERHDFGYRNSSEQHWCSKYWKGQINNNFYNDLVTWICGKEIIGNKRSEYCWGEALDYYRAVTLFGSCEGG